MSARAVWRERLEEAWRRAPVCWLSGVRRVGKTTLARALPRAAFFNCDLPEVVRRAEDPTALLGSVRERVVVFDEVHQLADPSRLLKIAADEFPRLKVLATGSSTLGATEKFRDALTGRKRAVHLVPVLPEELSSFGVPSLEHRLLRGGLPPALLNDEHDPGFYGEWLDSFFARDVRELFRVEKRSGFLLLVEALLRQSGGMMEATSLARAAGLSRPTVLTYLNALEITHAATIVRPWSGGRSDRELVQTPKVYGFDTGFVCHARGIRDLRPDDRGLLLEHLVLESLQAVMTGPRPHYWRDKSGRELDFVLPRGERVDAIEVKWSESAFDPKNLAHFRALYPEGTNYLVTGATTRAATKRYGALRVRIVPVAELRAAMVG
ncbi:MAG: ATP-binding protein [Deltaproteobacteria bacterium]|nr:ATP-binding protein [Deltaproteobacteria bacterium]